MKKFYFMAVCLLVSCGMFAQEYNHSVGLNLGSASGLSYKGFIFGSSNLALVVDANASVAVTQGMAWKYTWHDASKQSSVPQDMKQGYSSDKFVYWTVVANPNVVYQDVITSFGAGKLSWFAGAGFTAGMIQYAKYEDDMSEAWKTMGNVQEIYKTLGSDAKSKIGSSTPYGFKGGINALAGVELTFAQAPIALGLDFRPGWGYYAKDNSLLEQMHSFSFFDWSVGLSIRYCL